MFRNTAVSCRPISISGRFRKDHMTVGDVLNASWRHQARFCEPGQLVLPVRSGQGVDLLDLGAGERPCVGDPPRPNSPH